MAIVIYDDEWGVYLGTCLGLGFWSKLDPVGQDAAAVFLDVGDAKEHISGWDTARDRPYKFVEVIADKNDHWASIAACEVAGLPGWNPDIKLQ